MASPLERRLAELARRQQRQLATIAGRGADALSAAFLTLDGVGEEQLAVWLDVAVPLADSLALTAISAAYAFGGLYAGVTGAAMGALPDAAAIAAAVRPGTATAEAYTRPIVTARWALSQGNDFASAMSTGAANVANLVRTDVGEAGRAGASATQEATEGCTGYVRVPGAGACDYCTLVATGTYGLDHVAPAHPQCACGEAPVIGRHDPGRVTRDDALASAGMEPDEAADALDAMPVVDTETGPSTP